MLSSRASMPTTQLSVKLTAASASRRHRLQEIVGHHRVEDVELEVALAAGEGDRRVGCRTPGTQTMVSASHWVGLTLPGMIEEPGSFSGSDSSPRPERGARAEEADVVGDLEQRRGSRVDRAVAEHHGVVGGQRLELVGRGDERQAGDRGDPLGHLLGEAHRRVEAGADGRAALGQLVEPGQRLLDPARSPFSTWCA